MSSFNLINLTIFIYLPLASLILVTEAKKGQSDDNTIIIDGSSKSGCSCGGGDTVIIDTGKMKAKKGGGPIVVSRSDEGKCCGKNSAASPPPTPRLLPIPVPVPSMLFPMAPPPMPPPPKMSFLYPPFMPRYVPKFHQNHFYPSSGTSAYHRPQVYSPPYYQSHFTDDTMSSGQNDHLTIPDEWTQHFGDSGFSDEEFLAGGRGWSTLDSTENELSHGLPRYQDDGGDFLKRSLQQFYREQEQAGLSAESGEPTSWPDYEFNLIK